MSTAAAERPTGQTVERKLRAAWRRQRRFHNTRGLCHMLLWLAALLVVDFLVDWLFLLPGYGRVILLAVNLVALGVVFYRAWWRHLRRYDPVRVALQVERRHPELKSLLVSYVQFGRGLHGGENMSLELVEACRRLAIAATAPINFREIVNFRDLARVGVFSAVVVLACGGMSLNWAEFSATLFYRLLNPTAAVTYPTRTHITEITGDATIPEGASLTLEARCEGLVPMQGTLSIKPQDGQWEKLLLYRGDGLLFAYKFDRVFRGFVYRARVGDATSPTYEVRTVPAPHLVRTRVRLRYPEYTGLGTKEVDTLHLEVPEDTEVQWNLECDRPLAAAQMVREETEVLPMQVDAAGAVATLTRTVTKSFPCRFRWKEREHGFIYDGDVTYFVQVIPDTAPEVEVLAPTEDEKATVNKRLAVRFRATDDYRVVSAAIRFSVNDGPEQSWAIGSYNRSPVEAEAVWKLKDSIPNLKEGDVINLAVEVTDNRVGKEGPNVSRSRPFRLEIVSIAEYLRYIYEKRERLFKEMEALHGEETGAADEVKTLKEIPLVVPELPKPPAPPGEGK